MNISREAVQKGATELVVAKRYFKRSRRCMCFAFVLLLVIAIVIAVVIVVSIHPWK